MTEVPTAFEAWDECAAYVDGAQSRSRAITLARDCCWQLTENLLRRELRARRVLMRAIDGREAEEFFDGEIDSGYVEVRGPLNDAQREGLIAMWRVEPR